MATLNIKNFPDQLLDDAVAKPAPLSLLDLEGLGEATWRATLGDKDASEYIRDERDSWT